MAPDFWSDPKTAEVVVKKVSAIKFWVDGYSKAEGLMDDCNTLTEFGEDAAADLEVAFSQLQNQVESLEMRNMLSAEGDNLGAILKINSGAGGTESNDWSSMLMRMYMRWGAQKGFFQI